MEIVAGVGRMNCHHIVKYVSVHLVGFAAMNLQYPAVPCSILQYRAVSCRILLQDTARYCRILLDRFCRILQDTAGYYCRILLQDTTAGYCRILQNTAG